MRTVSFTLRQGETFIPLIALLKAVNAVESGSAAQQAVVEGAVLRNGQIELRKRAKIVAGDIVRFGNITIEVL